MDSHRSNQKRLKGKHIYPERAYEVRESYKYEPRDPIEAKSKPLAGII